jgi:hypothetical protein
MEHLGRTLISSNDLSDKKQYTFHGTEDIKSYQLKAVPLSDFWNELNFYKLVNTN